MTSTPTSGFVPVRLDAPSLLGAPAGRREAHHLSALSVVVGLAGDADWRTDTLDPFRSVAWAAEHHMAWRRLRRALNHLANCDVARAELIPFQPGTATLTSRQEPSSLLHDQARADERFVPLARGAIEAITAEHDLTWVATGLLILLLLLCDHRSAELAEDTWTKTSLSARYGIGWRRLSAGLDALAAAGLITYTVRRGGTMSLTLLARAALVAPLDGRRPPRHERRRTTRAAGTGTGPAAEVAARILSHHHLAGPPSPALCAALADALAAGTSPDTLVEAMAARGSLSGVGNPMAVLASRAHQVGAEIAAATDAAERRRAETAAERQVLDDARADKSRRAEQAAGEEHWLAATLTELPTPEQLGLNPLVARYAPAVAGSIHAACTGVVQRWADLDPAGLVTRWAEDPCDPEHLDTAGIGPRRAEHGPPGAIPQARDGPTLAERLATPTR